MKKVVTNRCYGGFGLSREGVKRYAELKGIDLFLYKEDSLCDHWSTQPVDNDDDFDRYYWSVRDIERDDPALIQTVEELGEAANPRFAHLSITEIPDDVEWEIEEYDGNEWVSEVHRTW